MTLYIVTQEGVYRHSIMGVYNSLDAARQRAIQSILAERDDYHDMSICTINLNGSDADQEIERYKRSDNLTDGKTIKNISKVSYHNGQSLCEKVNL